MVTIWLLAIASVDLRTATISNWLTLPALALLGGWRVVQVVAYASRAMSAQRGQATAWLGNRASAGAGSVPALVFVILAWTVCFGLWELHVVGGGDAKTLMGILALFPTVDFAVFLAIGVLVLSLPLLLLRHRDILAGLRSRLSEGHLWPSQRQLEEEGRPYAWTFCLPAVAYLWLLW